MTIPTHGEPVAPFTVATTAGPFSLRDAQGHWLVVYFYPRDSTPGCTREAADFRDLYPQFRRADAIILGISPDSLESHERFRARMELPFELGTDADHAVANTFGVWKEKNMYGKKVMGIERSTFLIDACGVLRQEWRKVKVEGHVAAVLAAVKSL